MRKYNYKLLRYVLRTVSDNVRASGDRCGPTRCQLYTPAACYQSLWVSYNEGSNISPIEGHLANLALKWSGSRLLNWLHSDILLYTMRKWLQCGERTFLLLMWQNPTSSSTLNLFTHSLYGAGSSLNRWYLFSLWKNSLPYRTRRFITVFKKAYHWSLFRARWIQFTTSHPNSLRYILILFYRIRLRLQLDVFPWSFEIKILYTFPIASIHATCPAYLIFLGFITLIIFDEAYELWSSSLCSFIQSPATFSLLLPNILLSILLSDTLRLCSSLDVRDRVSHPYKTTGKIMVLYVLIPKFLVKGRKTDGYELNCSKRPPSLICS